MTGDSFSFIKNVYIVKGVIIIFILTKYCRADAAMLISHKHKFIFIHIAKTGGSSVSHALMPYCRPRIFQKLHNYFHLLNINIFKPFPYEGHISARKLAHELGTDTFQKYFSFSMVRNPWDWQLSMYFFMLSRPKHPTHDTIKNLGSFENYIRWRSEIGMHSQKALLSNKEGKLIVDYVGRFEELQKHFDTVCEKIGVKADLPHKKFLKKKKPYKHYYSDKSRDLVAEFSKEDIDYFGYRFEQEE